MLFFINIYIVNILLLGENMIDTSKYLDKIRKSNDVNKDNNGNKRRRKKGSIINKILILVLIFIVNLVFIKGNSKYRDFVYKHIYNNNLSFAKIKEFYNKYLGGVENLDGIVTNTKTVFNETLTYKNKEKYKNGLKLVVEKNYLVPIINDGLVIFVGEKEGYGNVIIVGGVDGNNIWYGNMANTQVKLYDYVTKGSLLGEVNDNYLYIVYEKDGNYLDSNDIVK